MQPSACSHHEKPTPAGASRYSVCANWRRSAEENGCAWSGGWACVPHWVTPGREPAVFVPGRLATRCVSVREPTHLVHAVIVEREGGTARGGPKRSSLGEDMREREMRERETKSRSEPCEPSLHWEARVFVCRPHLLKCTLEAGAARACAVGEVGRHRRVVSGSTRTGACHWQWPARRRNESPRTAFQPQHHEPPFSHSVSGVLAVAAACDVNSR